jgi:hypothetical protein
LLIPLPITPGEHSALSLEGDKEGEDFALSGGQGGEPTPEIVPFRLFLARLPILGDGLLDGREQVLVTGGV